MPAEQLVKRDHPRQALGQPLLGEHLPRLVLDLDVVMLLSPVITHEQHQKPSFE